MFILNLSSLNSILTKMLQDLDHLSQMNCMYNAIVAKSQILLS